MASMARGKYCKYDKYMTSMTSMVRGAPAPVAISERHNPHSDGRLIQYHSISQLERFPTVNLFSSHLGKYGKYGKCDSMASTTSIASMASMASVTVWQV